MDSPYSHELKVAIAAVSAAARLSTLVLSQSQSESQSQPPTTTTTTVTTTQSQISSLSSTAAETGSASGLGVVAKDDLSPVTIGDFAIQALLTSTIHASFPQDRFVGEESADALRSNPVLLERVWGVLQAVEGQLDKERQWRSERAGEVEGREDAEEDNVNKYNHLVTFPTSPEQMCQMIDWCGQGSPSQENNGNGRIWVFDPIDGTENFVKGLLYAINVALLGQNLDTDKGKGSGGNSIDQVLSVVGCPNMASNISFCASDDSLDPSGRGCIVFGVRGHGAYVRTPLLPVGYNGTTAVISASSQQQQQQQQQDDTTTITDNKTATFRLPKLGYPSTHPPLLRSTTARNTSGLAAVHHEIAHRLGMSTAPALVPADAGFNPATAPPSSSKEYTIQPNAVPPSYPGNTLLPWVLRWVLLALGVGNCTWWVYKSRSRLAKIWDHAGAMLLYEEVGGQVSDADGREINWAAGRQMVKNWGIIAAPRAEGVFDKVLQTVKDVVRDVRPDLADGQKGE